MKRARTTFLLGPALIALAAAALGAPGCAAFRLADHAMPGIRFDRPSNTPLPAASDAPAASALEAWRNTPPHDRLRYPTACHRYARTPAPGEFEGEHIVGLAFSGGGTRGILFQAACIKELENLGAVLVDTPAGTKRVDLLGEVDYVSGISTGAIPAALFALEAGGRCPERFRREHWPGCFNINLQSRMLSRLALRPDWLVRDYVLEFNTRPLASAALASVYFEGNPFRPYSGLRFGDLPETPVLLIGATIINDPGTLFIHTRMPYRYALDTPSAIPWSPGVQTFETIHSNPMIYPLGEACYNSLSFPGVSRAGLIALHEDQPWVMDGLTGEDAGRMARARRQPDYGRVCYLKDGGMVDNRGVYILGGLFEKLAQTGAVPLAISLDAGWFQVRAPEEDAGPFRQGWLKEFGASSRTMWQTGQDAYLRLIEQQVSEGAYHVARIRYSAWTPFMPGAAPSSPETQRLLELCREEPLIGVPERLLEIGRGLGTTVRSVDEASIAAIRVSARFAVWLSRGEILAWAARIHGGAAQFETDAPVTRAPVPARPHGG